MAVGSMDLCDSALKGPAFDFILYLAVTPDAANRCNFMWSNTLKSPHQQFAGLQKHHPHRRGPLVDQQ